MKFPGYHYKAFQLCQPLDNNSDLIQAGRYALLIKSDCIDDYVRGFTDYYPYEDITLKVFLAEGDIETFIWGSEIDREGSSSNLITSTKIQNQFHCYGLAPRVFDLVYLKSEERRYICQVTTEARGKWQGDRNFIKWFFRTMRYLFEELGIEVSGEDHRPGNLIGFQWVDWQGLRYRDEEELGHKLLERVDQVAGWGPLDDAYQSVDCLGHKGRRPVDERIDLLKLANIDFTDKTVLDIGCSAGLMADYAASRGAQYVAGVDMPEIARVARDLANHLGIFNVNFFGYDASDPSFGRHLYWESRQEKFDIVFYLAMYRHLGYPQHIDNLVGRVLYFEGHGGVDDEAGQFTEKFQECFSKVELLGYSEDFGRRALLKCTR